MDIKTLESFKISDAISFHDELNPKLWINKKLRPEVKKQLLRISEDFLDELGIKSIDIEDITVSGSNAAYSYTPHSDLDLHILVDMSKLSNDEVYQELFTAKKNIYNDSHDIKIRDIPIELYIQDSNEPVVSLGEYSILNNEWIKLPTKRRANFDQTATKLKFEKLLDLIKRTLKTKDIEKLNKVIDKIKQYRKAGLDKAGEFGPENLAYKILRKQEYITKLYDLRKKLHSQELSLKEEKNEGDCFERAGKNILYKTDIPELTLVHGLVTGQGKIHGVRHVHAWNEIGNDIVLDNSNGRNIVMRKDQYYKLGKINPNNPNEYRKYDKEQARKWMAKTKHYGPWEISDDLTEEIIFDEKILTSLKPQLFVPRPKQLQEMHNFKPKAKIWTSTATKTENGFSSDWVEWCKDNMPDWITNEGILYDVASGVKILCMNTDEDALKIAKQYGVDVVEPLELWSKMPWDKIAQDYDAIHYFYNSDSTFFYGWDAESCAWFNTNFLINPRKVKIDINIKEDTTLQFASEKTPTVNPHAGLKDNQFRGAIAEDASGYIPSDAEKDDWRFKTALTVDIKPDSLQKNAKKLGSRISRAGIPPTLKANGKF
jgi:hypothetical protein